MPQIKGLLEKERNSAAAARGKTQIFIDIFDLSVFIGVYLPLKYRFPDFLF